MKNFDKNVLNKLIDKYEASKVSRQGSKLKLKINLKYNDKLLKKYWSEDSYKYRDLINFTLKDLSNKSFINVETKNNEINYINLNLEYVNDIYCYLSRINPEEQRLKTVNYLKSLNSKSEVINLFKKEMINRLENYLSVTSYFSDLKSLKQYIKTIEAILMLEEDNLKRIFSKMLFNDSKEFERIEAKVCKIIKEFSNSDIIDNDELLALYHIVKTPTFAYIKGDITLKVKNQTLSLSDYGHELALSSTAMLDLSVIDIGVKKVITIENLTTFIAFNDPAFICVYLGGFHNNVKRDLLRKISNYSKDVSFYHFGDIDAGGFLIFDDLVNKSEIDFIPYKMDINTLKTFKGNWMSLTKNDITRLSNINNKTFNEVIIYMLKNNCKLEQEAIDLSR